MWLVTNVAKMTRVTSLLTTRPRKLLGNNTIERLLNEEFSWNPEDLTADPVVGPPIHIDVEIVVKAITKMKTGKSCWSFGNSSGNAEGVW